MTQLPPREQSPSPVAAEQASALLTEIEQAVQLGAFLWYPERAPVWSDGFFRILGFAPGDPEIRARHFYERVHPEDLPALVDVWRRATLGETVGLTYRIVRLDGSTRWVEGRCIPKLEAEGSLLHILGTVEDVTEKHLANLALINAHAVLRDTQRAAGVGSHQYHLHTQKLEWSEELYRILGLDASTPVDAALALKVAHPDDRERQTAWGSRVAAGEQMPPLLIRSVRPDGEVRFLESRASRVELASGPAVQGVTLDVTHRVQMEERLRHVAKMEAIGTLAAGIAHDFNNYLAVISMQLELIGVGADVSEAVRSARHAADQCAEFTRQLLTFARKQPSAPRRLELAPLVETARVLIGRLLGATISLVVELPAEPLFVHGDPAQLESVLVNLAVNARDAMPRGGTFTLSLSRVSLERDDPRLGHECAPGDYVLVRATDTGVGIAAEHLGRIFEPYFSTKPVGEGTGLGLSMAYGSVRQHQGMMRVHSTLGQGTRFEIYLPALSEGEAHAQVQASRHAEGAAKLSGRALIVEDVEPLRDLALRLVKGLGLHAEGASDGQKALELVRAAREPYDVIVTDLMMPRLNGEELARAVSELAPQTRFIFMTGYADPDIEAALHAQHPGSTVLRKPFRTQELCDLVRAVLSGRPTD